MDQTRLTLTRYNYKSRSLKSANMMRVYRDTVGNKKRKTVGIIRIDSQYADCDANRAVFACLTQAERLEVQDFIAQFNAQTQYINTSDEEQESYGIKLDFMLPQMMSEIACVLDDAGLSFNPKTTMVNALLESIQALSDAHPEVKAIVNHHKMKF